MFTDRELYLMRFENSFFDEMLWLDETFIENQAQYADSESAIFSFALEPRWRY
jgi:hypothetical protein